MRRGRERHISSAVDRLIEGIGPKDGLSLVIREWPAVVGEALAAHSTPASLRDGRLVVECSGSVYSQELQLLSRKLIAALSEALGDGVVEELRFTVAKQRRDG